MIFSVLIFKGDITLHLCNWSINDMHRASA